MNIFGEALGDRGRWYIAIPPILLIAFLAGLFFLASAGQIRLEKANQRVRVSQVRQQALADFLALIRDAEASQRGYLLTGDPTYLAPYRASAPKLDSALNHLRESYDGNAAALTRIRDLRTLTGKKIGEQEATLALYEAQGATRAIQLVRTDFGEQVMDDIRQISSTLRSDETKELTDATSGWRTDLRATRWLTAGGAALNILLVVIAFRLVYKDLHRRSQQTTELRGEKEDLERLVNERTQELATLSTHLQSVSEREKYALARELHDELGGLLVASRMDLSWVEQHTPAMEGDVKQRIKRIHDYLSAGVDLKRRVVEELRPTLLDSMGLFAAMRWQFKESCGRAGLKCTETYPHDEPGFTPEASIAVFRILQESLTNILKHAQARSVDVWVAIDGSEFTLRISDDGRGISPDRLRAIGSHGLASMRHRVLALGGRFELNCPVGRGTVLTVAIPAERVLAAGTSAA
ncbi:MAG TPA: CHASE3 domain-containing protein [Steroidobacteraceae bacterium]|nr:CHASE3 domain-containing protein [Steroidobacteraceae bacterium]